MRSRDRTLNYDFVQDHSKISRNSLLISFAMKPGISPLVAVRQVDPRRRSCTPLIFACKFLNVPCLLPVVVLRSCGWLLVHEPIKLPSRQSAPSLCTRTPVTSQASYVARAARARTVAFSRPRVTWTPRTWRMPQLADKRNKPEFLYDCVLAAFFTSLIIAFGYRLGVA